MAFYGRIPRLRSLRGLRRRRSILINDDYARGETRTVLLVLFAVDADVRAHVVLLGNLLEPLTGGAGVQAGAAVQVIGSATSEDGNHPAAGREHLQGGIQMVEAVLVLVPRFIRLHHSRGEGRIDGDDRGADCRVCKRSDDLAIVRGGFAESQPAEHGCAYRVDLVDVDLRADAFGPHHQAAVSGRGLCHKVCRPDVGHFRYQEGFRWRS